MTHRSDTRDDTADLVAWKRIIGSLGELGFHATLGIGRPGGGSVHPDPATPLPPVLDARGSELAVTRARRWLQRRGDVFGIIVVRFPDLYFPTGSDVDDVLSHIGRALRSGVRDVDEVGRLDDQTFVAVILDIRPGTIEVVASRLEELMGTVIGSVRQVGGVFKVGAIEVTSLTHPPQAIIDTAVRLAREAFANSTAYGRL